MKVEKAQNISAKAKENTGFSGFYNDHQTHER